MWRRDPFYTHTAFTPDSHQIHTDPLKIIIRYTSDTQEPQRPSSVCITMLHPDQEKGLRGPLTGDGDAIIPAQTKRSLESFEAV